MLLVSLLFATSADTVFHTLSAFSLLIYSGIQGDKYLHKVLHKRNAINILKSVCPTMVNPTGINQAEEWSSLRVES